MLTDGSRLEILAALGVDVYRLRASGADTRVSFSAEPEQMAVDPCVAIACAAGLRGDARLDRLLAAVVRALGVAQSRVAWVETTVDDTAATLPDVAAWLLIGAQSARSCSARMSIAQQQASVIAVTTEPAKLGRDASSRRALWQTLKPLARRLSSA